MQMDQRLFKTMQFQQTPISKMKNSITPDRKYQKETILKLPN